MTKIKKPTKEEIRDFINSQQSLQFYKRTQKAFEDVFSAMPKEDFDSLTKNLIIVALHEGVLGQMMHFPDPKTPVEETLRASPKTVRISSRDGKTVNSRARRM